VRWWIRPETRLARGRAGTGATGTIWVLMKLYQAIVWIRDEPGIRVSISAESSDDARRQLEAEHGEEAVISLWSEDEAGRPR
jgi:hypothetical protein